MGDTTLEVVELPVRKWTQDYKEFLETMVKPEGKDDVGGWGSELTSVDASCWVQALNSRGAVCRSRAPSYSVQASLYQVIDLWCLDSMVPFFPAHLCANLV